MIAKTRLVFLMVFLIFTHLTTAQTYAVWSYYKDFTINTSSTGAGVAGNLVKFPLLIKLSSADSVVFNQAMTAGEDLRFSGVNAAGGIGTHYPYETELWDKTNKTAVIWVLVDTLKGSSATQKIRMYWGKSGSINGSNPLTVFDTGNGFQGVWHFNEGNNSSAHDATINNYDGAAGGTTPPTDTAGIVGRCRKFDGSTSYFAMTGTAGGKLNFPQGGTYTLSAWVNTNILDNAHREIISKGDHQYSLKVSSGNAWDFMEFNNTNGWQNVTFAATAGTWKHVVGMRNGAVGEIFVDGVSASTNIITAAGTGRVATFDVNIGKWSDNAARFFNGKIDEVEISNVVRSDDWIKLCYENQRSGSTMLTSGAAMTQAPSSLKYSPDSISGVMGTIIASDTPTVNGMVTTWAISPSLSVLTGLTFDTAKGIISGTPTVQCNRTQFIVTASNAGGSTVDTVAITVAGIITAPSNLNYRSNTLSCVVGTAIVPDTPSVTGTVTTWSISPSLSVLTGLSFDPAKGIISGAPTMQSSPTQFIITASNGGGSTADTVAITVASAVTAPSNLNYRSATLSCLVNIPIVADTPTVTGVVTAWSLSPSLIGLTGLSFDTTTGIISGAPTKECPQTKFIVTASNISGSAFDTVTITVAKVISPPSNLKYRSETLFCTVGAAIVPDTPTVTGVVLSWSISANLPLGLAFSATTGVLSGTPTLATTTVKCEVKASNLFGSAFDTLGITVLPQEITPDNNLVISGRAVPGGDSAEIFLDSVNSMNVDTLKIDSVCIGYNFADSAFFTSGNPPTAISAKDLLMSSVNGRYTARVNNPLFDGETTTVYCAVRLKGTNGLLSAVNKNAFKVGKLHPVNPIVLKALPVSVSQIELTWNRVGGGLDSIRIWYGKIQVPLNYDPSNITLVKLMASPGDSGAVISGLDPNTVYYFGAQVHGDGLWSLVTQQSSASAATKSTIDTNNVKNTAVITTVTFDSSTHSIKVSWTADTSVSGGDDLVIGRAYSLKGWPLDMSSLPSSLNTRVIKAASGVDTLRLTEKLLFDTTYYVGLWLKRSKGGWSPPVDSTRMGKVRIPSFSWQNVKYGVGQVDFAFNQEVRLMSDSGVDLTTDILDFMQFPATMLNGFIPVSICFSFREKNASQPFFIGVRYHSIPVGHSLNDVRMYRYDAATNSVMLDTAMAYYDTVNQYVSIKPKHIDFSFIAMIDTMSPQAQVLPPGTDLDAFVAASKDIALSFKITDNISNVKCKLEYSKGGSSYEDGYRSLDTWLSPQKDTIFDTILSDFVSPDYGLRAHLIISDGVHIDTIDLSRRVIRATSAEFTEAMKWAPLRVTAVLDDPSVKSTLKSLGNDGIWKYDPVQFRLFRWLLNPGNAANDTNKWVEYSDATDSLFTFNPGRLVWIKTRDSKPIDFGSGVTPSLKEPYTIELQPKTWSDIGLPYKFDIKVGDIVRTTVNSGQRGDTLHFCSWQKKDTAINGAKTSQYYSKYVFISDFAGLGTPFVDSNATIAGIGTVYNPLSVPVKLFIPPLPASMSKITAALKKKKEVFKGWSMGISGRTLSGLSLNTALCGYTNGKGAANYYPLPPTFDNIVISVMDEQKRRYAHVIAHGNWNKDGGVCYDLALTNVGNNSEEIELRIADYGDMPVGDFRIALFDPVTGKMDDATIGMRVVVGANACEYRKLIVGSERYLAKAKSTRAMYPLALFGAYPNPFKRTIRIQYGIPDKNIQAVEFSIVDLSGRAVWKTTLKQDALHLGLGAVVWNGKSNDDCPVSSGLYILRMTATGMNGKTSGVFEKKITYMP